MEALLLQTNYRSIGIAFALITFIGFVIIFFANSRKARKEIGNEIELAANRKEYYDDEDMEGLRLDRSLSFALVSLLFIALSFGFYMIAEPGRQEGAVQNKIETFQRRGEDTYVNGAQCVNCHAADGSGGGAAYVLQDADGQFIANANWMAPALNNVLLRYSEEEITYILNFGRNGSPMAAWGTPGGGPLTSQAVQNVIEYLKTLQVQSIEPTDIAAAGNENPDNSENDLDDEESQKAQEEADRLTASVRAEVDRSLADGEFATVGEAVFNLGLYSGFGAGSYSCARCHTSGWSLGIDASPNVLDEGVAACGGGTTGIGFNLCGGSIETRFPNDTWKMPDGSWMPPEGLTNDDGESIVLTMDGTEIVLDERGRPVDADGNPYLVLTDGLIDARSAAPAVDEPAEEDEIIDDETTAAVAAEVETGSALLGLAGDLAQCDFVSELYTPADGATYPVDPDSEPVVGEDGELSSPEALNPDDFSEPVYTLDSGRLASGCEIIEMPERTSDAHYDFIYDGANAGQGYGNGGMSSAGMMPGFGKMLPPEYIQAVVDYERGLE